MVSHYPLLDMVQLDSIFLTQPIWLSLIIFYFSPCTWCCRKIKLLVFSPNLMLLLAFHLCSDCSPSLEGSSLFILPLIISQDSVWGSSILTPSWPTFCVTRVFIFTVTGATPSAPIRLFLSAFQEFSMSKLGSSILTVVTDGQGIVSGNILLERLGNKIQNFPRNPEEVKQTLALSPFNLTHLSYFPLPDKIYSFW